MKIARLFNALVVGGAALAANGCSDAPISVPDATPDEPDAAVAADAAPDTNTPDAVAADSSPTEDAAPADAQADVDVGDGGCKKTCTELGMPCCWMGDCTKDISCAAQLCK